MYFPSLFFSFLYLFKLIHAQNVNLHYNVTSLKLRNGKCNEEKNKYSFEIECNINPSPIFDMEFDLDLSSPKGVIARCKLIDDVIDVIKCHININVDSFNKKTFSISENKNIKVNENINIYIEKLKQNWIADCSFGFLYINTYFLIIVIILLI